MRKVIALFIILFAVTLGVHHTAYAQNNSDFQFSFHAGFPLTLHSDYHNNFSTTPEFNYNLGVGMHYAVSSWMRTGLEFQYYHFSYKEDEYSRSTTRNNARVLQVENLPEALSLMVSNDFFLAKFRNSAITPLLSFDFGATRITERETALVVSSNESSRVTATYNNWGASFGIGAGFTFPLSSHLNLQIETRYTAFIDSASQDIPIRFMPISASLYF